MAAGDGTAAEDGAWAAVAAEAVRLRSVPLGALLADPAREAGLVFSFEDLSLDLSREKLDARALDALLALARARGVGAARDAMAAGAAVNGSEGRAALHMALRDGAPAPAGDEVAGERARFLGFAEAVRTGRVAAPGGPVREVVHIGIGGSDLGPALAVAALAPDCDGPRVHFVSNADGAHLADTLRGLDPRRCLVIAASKSFGTEETLMNLHAARGWLAAGGGDPAGQVAAVTARPAAAAALGIAPERVFRFWDWVGGRYSVWSAVGLPLALAVGAARFAEFLAGAAAMDAHFLAAPLPGNLPVLAGLAAVWRRSAMGWPCAALVPYDQRLARLPAHVQQLDMESLGKGVAADGAPLARPAGTVVWGEPGTNAEHSFFQLLHQGREPVPVDFVLAAEPRDAPRDQHAVLAAHCLAQAEALALGRSAAEAEAAMLASGMAAAEAARLAPHRAFPGDRPSTLLLHRRLDARALGRLLAFFEHRVAVQAAVWGVNPFDQWGVELGKEMARALAPALAGGPVPPGAPAGRIARLRALGGG